MKNEPLSKYVPREGTVDVIFALRGGAKEDVQLRIEKTTAKRSSRSKRNRKKTGKSKSGKKSGQKKKKTASKPIKKMKKRRKSRAQIIKRIQAYDAGEPLSKAQELAAMREMAENWLGQEIPDDAIAYIRRLENEVKGGWRQCCSIKLN